MTKTEKFQNACIAIKKRDGMDTYKYTLLGKGRDKAVTLRHPYGNIAMKYLYCEHKKSTGSTLFSWQQVTDACILADLYVTTVVYKQYPGSK